MDTINVVELVERLGSDEDAVRKMAAFKLQTSIADPSFADAFMNEGGITKLRWLALYATGNTLAYSLAALSKLLEVDMGWDSVDQTLVTRVVELVVTHPLVNILRGAMSILASVVSHPHNVRDLGSDEKAFGFRALKPAIALYPQFLETLVSKIQSADHALSTNALQLINSLMRDAITSGTEHEWPKLVKRLQDLGVIRAVYGLMQSSALQDLAQPLLDFQSLTKVLLRKWREVAMDANRSDHRRAIKGVYRASNFDDTLSQRADMAGIAEDRSDDWIKLGFTGETLSHDFEEVGFLGMMDLADYVRKNEDAFRNILLEQFAQPEQRRCPIARASIVVTSILYEHFEIDKAGVEDVRIYMALDSTAGLEKTFKPLLLQWSKLHTSGLQAFLRLWKATNAELPDFPKVAELVRILIEAIVGSATRTKDVHDIEEEMQDYGHQRLRELQMELFELSYEDTWGHYLRQVREELDSEALQFIREQRIRCLLAGAWFPFLKVTTCTDGVIRDKEYDWGFVVLSHNRRHLHYRGFHERAAEHLSVDEMFEKVDLSTISSVISNVTAAAAPSPESGTSNLPRSQSALYTHTRISITGVIDPSPSNRAHSHKQTPSTSSQRKETPLMTLHPQSHSLAAEWLDGLLMLLGQSPITSETKSLSNVVGGWGLKIRLLNVDFDNGEEDITGAVPSREGLDDNYYYDIIGGS